MREHTIDIEDMDFGGIRIAYPRSIANFPTKCKITIRRKDQVEGENELIEKVNEVTMEDKMKEDQDKEKQTEKARDDDETNKDNGLLV